jgi:hypothetical protein
MDIPDDTTNPASPWYEDPNPQPSVWKERAADDLSELSVELESIGNQMMEDYGDVADYIRNELKSLAGKIDNIRRELYRDVLTSEEIEGWDGNDD